MAKDVINVDGEDRVVREDTAKSYRGTKWALTVVGIVVIIAAILFLAFGLGSTTNKDLKSPAEIEQKRQ